MRTYSLPVKYMGKEMVMIETLDPEGHFKSRMRAIVIFRNSFKYKNSKLFYSDSVRHKVDKNSP